MSFVDAMNELSAAEANHGAESAEVADALQKMIDILRAEGQATKCLPLLLRLKEIRQSMGKDCTDLKSDIRALLLTKDWPVSEETQDDSAQPSSSSSSGPSLLAPLAAPLADLKDLKFDATHLSENADVVSRVIATIGARTLGTMIRGSGQAANVASDGVSHTSQALSALCLDSGRTKTAVAIRVLDFCSRSVFTTWSYASNFSASCVERAAEPVINFSTRRMLDGAVLTAQGAGKVWNAVSGVYSWTSFSQDAASAPLEAPVEADESMEACAS
eukprot:GEMP01052594.1.p1 GENE.GEMP01052594.1~~GEMP01052594.1.p1  ORF type:complete len:274 (+),score=54.14 GEMP01052594.1:99-920(+)